VISWHCRPQEWHSHIHQQEQQHRKSGIATGNTNLSERTGLYYRSAPQHNTNHQRRGNVPVQQECPATTLQRLPTSERTCPCNGSAPLNRQQQRARERACSYYRSAPRLLRTTREQACITGVLRDNNTTYRNPRSGRQSVQADSHSERPLHPIQSNSVGRSGGKPHDKLVGNGADSDDDFIPATPTAQATTISHSYPTIL
jgi:hypothetical protein